MTSSPRAVRPLVVSCSLALAEAYFPRSDGMVSTDHAQLLLSGRIDTWPGYWGLADPDRQRVTDLLRHRPDELASAEAFGKALRTLTAARRLDGYHVTDADAVAPDHGMNPVAFADRLLALLGELRRKSAPRLNPAQPGRYRTTLRVVKHGHIKESTRAAYNLTDISAQPKSALPIIDAPRADKVEFGIDELLAMAERIDTARGEHHRHERLKEIFDRLQDTRGRPVTDRLRITAGVIQNFQAPTGTGKSVLLEVLGTLAGEKHLPIALVVPKRATALHLAYRIENNLGRLEIDARCTPLLSPAGLMADAEKAATNDPDGFGAWAYECLGYGCALAASAEVDDSADTWNPGDEPCRELYEVRADGQRGGRHACPWRTTCGKFRLMRDAMSADVIVTAHQTFFSGMMHLPLGTAAATTDRVGVEEFILRRCQLVLVDELDQFQASVIDKSARHLVLADGRRDTSLNVLDTEFRNAFGQALPEVDGEVRPTLADLRLLAEGYTANLAHGWLPPVRPHRPGWRTDHWLVPRGHDGWITARLLGIPDKGRAVTPDEVEALQQLYPTPDGRPVPPLRLAGLDDDEAVRTEIAQVLAAIADGCRDRILPLHRARLGEILTPVIGDDAERGQVVDRMIRRAYLEPLRRKLSELFFHTSHLRAVGADSAERIADALGGFTGWSAMPASPLGRLFLAFQERLDPETPEQAKLSVAAFGGDPHAYTLYLGELTARAHAGVPRAVLGLSATSYFPGAPHHHVHVEPTWAVADTDPTGVTVHSAIQENADGQFVRVSGVQGVQRTTQTKNLGELLYPDLATKLDRLAEQCRDRGRPGRDRILVATTSYAATMDIAEGMVRAGAPRGAICVAARPDELADAKDSRWDVLPTDQVERFPATSARILIAPLAVVERGVNILDGDVSALGAIYLVVRPIPIIDEPAQLLAHINHRLWAESLQDRSAGAEPLDVLEGRMKDAGLYFAEVVRSAQFFRSLPDWVQHGVVAEIIVGLIQLVGRARRGGTPGDVHLVDYAFFDTRSRADLPSLILQLRQKWENNGQLERLLDLYGPTLRAFFDFAERHNKLTALSGD
jgi:hypothetical protein